MRNHENWLKAYMQYTRASESPDAFHFWTGVSTIAGALRRRVWIDQRIYKWTPNFYIILVAPAGIVAKSTSIGIGLRLLDHLKGIHFGPASMTWQALTRALQDSIETYEYRDREGEAHKIPMSCLTIPVSELGTFLRPDDQAFVDVLTDMWDGKEGKWIHRTITSGAVEVINPWLNVIGATTPAWLRKQFPEHMIGGGLASRIVFIYGDRKRHYTAYPAREVSASEFKSLERSLREDLLNISSMIGEYQLTEEAYVWGEGWYRQLWEKRPPHMASDRFDAYISRKQTHIHKLAMVLAAARSSKLILDREHLEEADQLLTSSERYMLKVFENIGSNPEAQQIHTIKHYLGQYSALTLGQLWALCMSTMPYKAFEEGVRGGVDAGIFEPVTIGGKKGLRLSAKGEAE